MLMPSLRSATATAGAVAPAPIASMVAPEPEIIVERRSSDQPFGRIDRRARPARNPPPAIFSLDQPRFPNKYVRLVDLALVLACLSIFIGVLAVGILG